MKLVVTGAGGFLGHHVVDTLAATDCEVIPTARVSADGCRALDLSEAVSITAFLDDIRPDAIINCAAIIDFASGTLGRQYPVNSLAPAVMGHWCSRNGAFLLQVSTVAICGARTERIGTDSAANPDTDYAVSKDLAERMIAASGADHACVRFGGIFGSKGPAHLGINRVIADAREGTRPTVIGSGSAKRNYIHVSDAAALLADLGINRKAGIYTAGGRQVLTIAEMLSEICDEFLPDSQPLRSDGPDACDQIVVTDHGLPKGLGFRKGLARCR